MRTVATGVTGSLFFSLLFLVWLGSLSGVRGWAQAEDPSRRALIRTLLTVGRDVAGANCAAAALLNSGALDVPFFIAPGYFDEALRPCFSEVKGTGNNPPQAREGDIGVVSGPENAGSSHFYGYVDEHSAFTRRTYDAPFQVLPIAEARALVSTSARPVVEILRYQKRADCPLETFKREVARRDEQDPVKVAYRYLSGKYGLGPSERVGGDMTGKWAARLLTDLETRGQISDGGALHPLERRMLVDAINLQDMRFSRSMFQFLEQKARQKVAAWRQTLAQTPELYQNERAFFLSLFSDQQLKLLHYETTRVDLKKLRFRFYLSPNTVCSDLRMTPSQFFLGPKPSESGQERGADEPANGSASNEEQVCSFYGRNMERAFNDLARALNVKVSPRLFPYDPAEKGWFQNSWVVIEDSDFDVTIEGFFRSPDSPGVFQ